MIVRRDKLGAVAGALLVSALSLGGCGSSTASSSLPRDAARGEGQHATDRSADIPQDVDYVAIGPRDLLVAIEPLLKHREARGHVILRLAIEDLTPPNGLASPDHIKDALRKVASERGARLRFVLLVGDVPGEGERVRGFTEVPTAYQKKVKYRTRDYEWWWGDSEFGAHGDYDDPRDRYLGERFATDWPYARALESSVGAEKNPTPLAVGRVPARRPEQVAAFARKVIEYETQKTEGAWRRSVTIFGSQAKFGAVSDFMIERTMTETLDEAVPYDWDIDLIYPKLGSPYAYPFPELASRLVSRLEQGALIAGYVGHGSRIGFDHVLFRDESYRIGEVFDLAKANIGEGKPFFISLACKSGYFDLPGGQPSVAEELILNPGGAIAVFAASRDSHPYTNAIYGQAIVRTFIDERAPTIGEGIVLVKKRMLEGDIPLAPILFESDPGELAVEHEALYNLFGDPATVLRYPARATVSVQLAKVPPSEEISVTVESKEIPSGKVELTLETKRSVVRVKAPRADELAAMTEDEAVTAMRKTYEAAMDKVVSRQEFVLSGGRASVRVKMPEEAGDYAIKAFVRGGGEAAAGFVKVIVGK